LRYKNMVPESTDKVKKERELTIKQQTWLKLYIQTGNATEAAMQVYNCKSRDYASNIGYQNVTKLQDHARMREALDMANLGVPRILQVASEGLNATQMAGTGAITPDFRARQRFLDTLLKLRDAFPARKQEITAKVAVDGDASLIERVKGINAELVAAEEATPESDMANGAAGEGAG